MLASRFMEYVVAHNKSYITSEEFAARQALFAEAEDFINLHNSTTTSFTVAHNFFSDMTEDEKKLFRGRLPEQDGVKAPVYTILDESNTSSSVDWRGVAVNPIRNQGSCGSCWAFSSVCAMEGAHYIATGTLAQFSEQQLVDCAKYSWGNLGCSGGLQENAFNYYESYEAINRDSYPYTAKNGSCQYTSLKNEGVDVSNYVNTTPGSVSQTKAAIAQQPISVSIEADKMVFQLYSGGVFDSDQCGTSLDHAVALVGYGTDAGQDYFILRNSWGVTWGEQGYMRISTDTGSRNKGICGVLSDPLYPNTN